MKRDWDTLRELLAKLKGCTMLADRVRPSDFQRSARPRFHTYMQFLIEAGLVKGQVVGTIGPEVKDFFGQRLTWDGHEFLDAIRSDTVSEKTKKIFTEQGVSMTFELVKTVAKETATSLRKGALGS